MEFFILPKILWILFFVPFLPTIKGQSCRNFFNYVQGSDGETEGQITLYLPQMPEHILKVILTVAAQLPTTYVGEISLTEGTSKVAEDVNNGEAVLYRIRFPITNPVPKMTEIYHNDISICKGEKASSTSYLTTITLMHRLRVVLNGQSQKFPFEPDLAPPHEFRSTTEPYAPIQQTTSLSFQEIITQQAPIRRYSPAPNLIENKRIIQSSNQCGVREGDRVITSLVINGLKAVRTEFPWLVVHYHIRRHFICGGSLISNRIVLTAAHCIWGKGKSQPVSSYESTYYMGKYKLNDLQEDGYISSDVHSFIIHPKWKPHENSYDSDIAIAVLAKRIIYSDTIKPICIWSNGVGHFDLIGKRGVIAGWGLTERGKVSDYPMYVVLPAVDDGQCLRSNPGFLKISSGTNFCVGDQSGMVPCQGDSGGAFMVRYANQFYLRGIVSAAIIKDGSCSREDYTLLTDVSFFTDWINYYVTQYSK